MSDFDYYLNEQMILGCLMMFPEKYADKMSIISSDLFDDVTHKDIFNTLVKVYKERKTIDTALVSSELPIDCREEIINCSNSVLKTTPFEEHLKILIESAEKSYLCEACKLAILDNSLNHEKLSRIADFAAQAFSVDEADNRKSIYSEYITQLNKPRDVMFTYFPKLDGTTKGLQRGTLSIIGARPSVGKTTFALNIASNLALHDKKVMFFTLEMTAKMIIDKLLSAECKIPYSCFNGKIGEKDRNVISNFLNNETVQNNLEIIDNIGTVEAICSNIASENPDVVIIDYVQIVQTMKKFSGDSKRAQIDYISSELKSIAKRTHSCIILLSQLKRSEKVKQPTMADLKESGGLEQDGDYILMLFRPYAQDKSAGYSPEETTLMIEKNKFGETGIIKMNFNGRFQTFTEC